jgi:phenylacetate-CoA ligase
VRNAIERTWGIRAIDANYGMADVLSIFGAECNHRQGLHFHGRGLLHPELIDPETGRTLPFDAGQEGELVLTNLTRQAQPLVRFRSGDLIRIVGTSTCACGRSSFRFLVVGRSDQMIVVQGINVFAGAVKNVLARHPEHFGGEFEIVVDHSPPIHLPLLRVEAPATPSPESEAAALLVRICREELQFTPRVQMLPFGSLPRTEGKTRYVRRTYETTSQG